MTIPLDGLNLEDLQIIRAIILGKLAEPRTKEGREYLESELQAVRNKIAELESSN